MKSKTRSPFREDDELANEKSKEDEPSKAIKKKKGKVEEEEDKLVVSIDRAGIQKRIIEVPVKPGNYGGLEVNEKALYVGSADKR